VIATFFSKEAESSGEMPTHSSSAASSQHSGQYEIPRELQEVLLDFTVHYLIEQPPDLVNFALDYFNRLGASRGNGGGDADRPSLVQQPPTVNVVPASVAAAASDSGVAGAGGNSHSDDDDESMLSDDDIASGQIYKATTRRKSVFAETYDPEEDEQEEKPVVHPKSDSQRKSLLEAVKEILLFRSLDQEQLGEVLDAMFERKVNPEEYIIKQGDDGDNFYVVESGVYNIYVNDGTKEILVGKCDNSGSFGELALMYNMPRAATVQAATEADGGNGMLWAMDRQTFRRIVLRNAFQKRKMYESLLESVPLLSALNPYERMNLADALTAKKFDDGSVIVKQGSNADGMYFIESGVVDVHVIGNDGKTEKLVTTIKNGGYFGELALVTHKPRAATVTANGDIRVAFLDVNAFERLLGPCMDVMKRNVDDYEEQLVRIFGGKANISDIR